MAQRDSSTFTVQEEVKLPTPAAPGINSLMTKDQITKVPTKGLPGKETAKQRAMPTPYAAPNTSGSKSVEAGS